MVHEPFKMERILSEFVLRLFYLALFFLEFWIFWHFVKLVTFIVSSRSTPMFSPRCLTDPTPTMTTRSTSHMVTTLIFFYRLATFLVWTVFSICHNPGYILAFCWVFYFPLSTHFTSDRIMVRFATENAKLSSTLTRDWILNSCVCFK